MRLPGGKTVDGDNIRQMGADQSEEWANTMRSAGYTVFAVALGDPNASNPLEIPDLEFLRRIANDDAIVSSSQPVGKMLFAPTVAELDTVFSRLADRILTRLTQ
jgi:hypothetical protein